MQESDSPTPPPVAPPRADSAFFGRRSQPQSPAEALQPALAPPPPEPVKRKRHPVLSTLSGLMSFLLIGAILAAVGLVVAQRQLRTPGPLTADKTVVIAAGTDAGDIIDQLDREGVISNAFLFNVALVTEGTRSKLKAGEYLFKQGASVQDVMDTLVAGKAILHSLTIPEGLTSEQIVQRLRDNDILVGDIRDIPREGSLLPETYKFSRGTSRGQIVDKMIADQSRVLKDIWAKRAADLPIKSSFELVTLASIVEKETGKADERPRVAGVFINRLGKRMKLQSDPTIVYGLVGGKGTLGRGITRAELDQPSAYNTYVIEGLPPGPIANPGRAAMEAVANPSRTKDLFFVADGTGGHAFADTLDAHNKNVLRWRQIERDAKDKLSPDLAPPPPAVPPGTRGELEVPLPPTQGSPASGVSVFGALSTFEDETSATQRALAAKALAAKEAAARQALAAKLGAPAPAKGAVASAVPAPNSPPVAARAPASAPQAPLVQQALPAQTATAQGGTTNVQAAPAAAPKSAGRFAVGPDIEDLSAYMPGAKQAAAPDTGFFGEVEGEVTANAQTFPVSPTRVAEQKAKAALYGLADGPAAPAAGTGTYDPKIPSVATPDGAPRPRAKYVDASEGTPLDPLRNKSYDLTTAKTVPSLAKTSSSFR